MYHFCFPIDFNYFFFKVLFNLVHLTALDEREACYFYKAAEVSTLLLQCA